MLGSPCIDSADPGSGSDPDGSVRDMGALPTYKSIPIVWTTNPPSAAQDVPRDTDIAVTFNMPMAQETINSDNFSVSSLGGGRSGTITYDPLSKTATFTPDELFQPGETISVNISQHVSNLWGVEMGLGLGWSFEITTATEVQTPDPAALPDIFALQQNYPNPFNAETIIRFHLRESGPTQVKIYDVGGRLVKTLVAGDVASGTHLVVWDGTGRDGQDLASGVYFYMLEADAMREMRRMVLLR